MKGSWPDFAYDMYKKACIELNYPEVPFLSVLREFIRPEDVVADIGCGIGMPAMYISKLCREVIAVDQNKAALDYLNREMLKSDIKNIKTIHGTWPNVKIGLCDAAVALYASGIAKSREGVTALVNAVRRGGIITSNGTLEDDGFFKGLAEKLGVKPRTRNCDNGCYLKGSLEMLGCRVKCHQTAHDFGQPIDDLNEAAKFLSWQLMLDDSYLEEIKKASKEYITTRNGKLYIPNLRTTCVIVFEK